MISAGERDRLIKVAGIEFTDDDSGAPLTNYGEWIELWAKKESAQLSQVVEAHQRQPLARVAFVVEFGEDLTLPLAVQYDGTIYHAESLEEIGYRQDLRIVCQAVRRAGAV